MVAHLYGLSEPQLVHIFETFHEGWHYEARLNECETLSCLGRQGLNHGDKPDFIDNRDGNTMVTALRQLLARTLMRTVVVEPSAQVDEARIATAYFSPSGFGRIAPAIKNIPSIRLLLGTDPIADSDMWQKQIVKQKAALLPAGFVRI